MAIKKEREVKNKINIKGILTSIGEGSMEVLDDKTGETDTFEFNDLDIFVGKSFKFSMVETIKKDMEKAE